MKKLSEKNRAKLKPLEHFLRTATEANYIRTVTRAEAETLSEVYSSLGYGQENIFCGKCLLKICQTLGKLYFN